jgi:hypothetical protein
MNCVLTADQQRQLYAKVFKDLLNMADSNKPFNFKGYASSFYKGVFDKTNDHGLALNYVSMLPQNINTAFGQRLPIRVMLKQLMGDLVDLEVQFKDLDQVAHYIGVGPISADQIKKSIEEDARISKETKPVDRPADKPVDFKGKPFTSFASWGQEAYFLPFNNKLTKQQEVLKDVPDPGKAFHYNIFRSLLDLKAESELPFDQLTMGGHTGFKITAMNLEQIPQDSWYPEMLDETLGALTRHVYGPKVALAITDNYGTPLYFTEDGNITYQYGGGKVAHMFLRSPVKKGDKFELDYGPVVPTEDIIRKENAARRDQGLPQYTAAEEKARVEVIEKARQAQFSQLNQLAQYILSASDNHVVMNIVSGSKGFVDTTKLTPMSKTNITHEAIKFMDLGKSKEKGKGRGYALITAPGIDTPIQVDRMEMTRDIANKIAHILTRDMKVDGREMFPDEKVAFVKQFLIPDSSQYTKIEYNVNTPAGVNPITFTLNGVNIPLPPPGTASDSTKQTIIDTLMTMQSYKTRKGPARMNFDTNLLQFGQYTDYDINGINAKETKPNYYDFVRDHAKVYAAINAKGDIIQLNAYLTFDIPAEQIQKIQGKIEEKAADALTIQPDNDVKVEIEPEKPVQETKEEDKKELKKAPLKKKDLGQSPDDILKGLKKLKGLDNKATQEEIAAAKTWFESSPLSKHIKFETMFNVVNSDAFAQWTTDGIVLFQGSNYTDLYHEAWHGFSQLYLTKDQKDDLYNDMRKVSGTFSDYKGRKVSFKYASDLAIEEYLAEEFRKYAMSKPSSVPAKTKNIFQKILAFLRAWFSGNTTTDVVSNPMEIKAVREIYDKLYFGALNEYTPSTNNAIFGVLNQAVTPLKEEYQPMSLEDSKLMVDTIDSLFSDIINEQNQQKQTSRFTTSIFSSKSNLVVAYSAVKEKLTRMYNDTLDDIEKETDEFKKQRLTNNAILLDQAIENFGDIRKVLDGKEKDGIVFYHHKKSKYLGVSTKFYELVDEASMDEDDLTKGLRIGDRTGNELSLKQLANAETIYLIKSLHKMKDGQRINNKLGVPELVDFDKVWNSLVRTLAGSTTPQEIYNRLTQAQGIHQEFTELLEKLGQPVSNSFELGNAVESSQEEFDMQTRFWQDFNKPQIPLVQLIIDKVDVDMGNQVEMTSYEMRGGEASSDTFKVKSNFRNLFMTDSPLKNPYIKQGDNRVNYLNLDKVLKDFGSRGNVPLGKEFDFLKAVGFYLDDKPEIRDMVKQMREVFGVNYMLESLQRLKQFSDKEPEPYLIADPVDFLSRDHKAMGIKNNARRVKEVLKFHTTVSDEYSNFMSLNPENNRVSQFSLNNSISNVLTNINKADTYQDLIAMPDMGHMDYRRNPFIKSSVWLNSVFTLDVPEYDSEFGKKRIHQNKPVTIKLENLSGVQILVNSQYPEAGVLTSSSDRTTKFLSEFHMLLLYGRLELMRHASKSTAYDVALDVLRTSGNRTDGLYVPITSFVSAGTPNEYLGFTQAFDIIKKYLDAELKRVMEVRNNSDKYKNATGYNRKVTESGQEYMAGEVLTIFSDMFPDKMKQRLYSMAEEGNFLSEIEKPENAEFYAKVRDSVKSYFDEMTGENKGIMNENPYYHPEIMRKISASMKGLSNEQMEQAALRAFTYNSWIHNVESTINIYGDLAQFNHDKEELHKRNAGAASTGDKFRTDEAAIQFINTKFGRPFASSLIKAKTVSIQAPKMFDGTFSTAIMKDIEIPSVYAQEYTDAFHEYFTDLYTRNGLTGEALNKKVAEKVKSASKPYLGMTEADGQGWVTFDAYRIMRKLEGKWTNQQEELYQRIVAGNDVSMSEALTFLPPYKVQYYGPLNNSVKEMGLPITAFHKFSLFPLIPSVVKGTNLEKLHTKMINEGIDYGLFSSGSKVGGITSNGKPDSYYSEAADGTRTTNDALELTPNIIHLNYLKDQQDIASQFKGKVIFSTQLRKLIIEGLFEQGVPVDYTEGKDKWESLSTAEKIKASPFFERVVNYESNIRKLTELKKQELLKEAGWSEDKNGNLSGKLEDLLDVIRKEMESRDFADHDMEYIEVDKNSGELRYDLSLHYNVEKVEKLLTSMVNNSLIRQKSKGESLVQVSTSMFENLQFKNSFTKPTEQERKKYLGTNDLPTYHRGKGKNTTAMKVKIAMQGNFENILSHPDVVDLAFKDGITTTQALNKLIKDEEWLNKADHRKLITMVGVRIPVQGLNSMEFMEVYEFLPPSAGNIIVPPSEIVAKAGADFDIDKLTVLMPAIYKNSKFASREFNTIEEIDAEITKLEEQRKINWETVNLKLKEMREALKNNKEVSKETKRALIEAKENGAASRESMLSEVRQIINNLKDTNRMPSELVDAANNLNDQELIKALNAHEDELSRIDLELSVYYNNIKRIKIDVLERVSNELRDLRNSSNRENEEYYELESKISEEKRPINTRLSELREQRRMFISTVENDLISNIRSILELPHNYVSLIRPNDTDIVKPEAEKLADYTQSYDPKTTQNASRPGKGVNPSTTLRYAYNLYKHEQNNVGKKTLGMAASENPYSTIFNRIGAYLENEYIFSDAKGDQHRRGKLLLEHHKYEYKDAKGVKKEGISLSNLYDIDNENRVSDVISQIMNGLVDIEKDAWIANLQGNQELMPTTLFLLKAGVPIKTAAWFVSQPLVLQYVNEQRIAKSTFGDPLGKSPRDSKGNVQRSMYKYQAKKVLLEELRSNPIFEGKLKKIGNKAIYNTIVDVTDKVFSDKGITQDLLEDIVKKKDTGSPEAIASFLHFLEIQDLMQGISDVKFKTKLDTKKSPDLYTATKRMSDLQSLREGQHGEVMKRIMNETVIGAFEIQDFQIKLGRKIFPFRTNDMVTDYLTAKLRDFQTRDDIQKTFGDEEDFVNAFNNDLVLYIFQNHIRGFKLDGLKTYKGYSTAGVPVKFVDSMKAGAIVKDGVIHIDKAQLELDWSNKSYLAANQDKDSYNARGLTTLKEDVFYWNGVGNKNEFFHYVVEREYMRSVINLSQYKQSPDYESDFKYFQSLNPKASEAAINKIAYEEMLKKKALQNIFNLHTMMSNPTQSVAGEFLTLINKYPSIQEDFSLIANMGVSHDRSSGIYNLMLKDKDLDSYKLNTYHENYKKLADVSEMKVPDLKQNMEISQFFQRLPLYAYMQSGLSNNQFSLTHIVSPEPFLMMMDSPLKDFTSNYLTWSEYTRDQALKKYGEDVVKMLDKSDSYKTLNSRTAAKREGDKYLFNDKAWMMDIFYNYFVENNSSRNRRTRSRYRDYTINVANSDVAASIAKRSALNDFERTTRPDLFVYKTTKGPELTKLAQSYPEVLFVFNDTYNGRKINLSNTGTEMNLRDVANSVGIRTAFKSFGAEWGATTPEQVQNIKEAVESDLQPLIEAKAHGKLLAFSPQGYGTNLKGMDREIFVYLSKRLYEEFGYINPGSVDEPSVRDVIDNMQGISQAEIDELMSKCMS